MLPSQQDLRALLVYDPDEGHLYWQPRDGNASFNARDAWTKAMCTPMKMGYLCGRIGGKTYYTHRIIWKFVYGEEPEFVDHINHRRDDNRLVNLRKVTRTENNRNVSKGSRNTSGHVGVIWDKDRGLWIATIKVNGRNHHLGRFAEISEAIAARWEGERKYGFHPNHGRNNAA
jgi:hypothetical protein